MLREVWKHWVIIPVTWHFCVQLYHLLVLAFKLKGRFCFKVVAQLYELEFLLGLPTGNRYRLDTLGFLQG